jgi:hypothetical protein
MGVNGMGERIGLSITYLHIHHPPIHRHSFTHSFNRRGLSYPKIHWLAGHYFFTSSARTVRFTCCPARVACVARFSTLQGMALAKEQCHSEEGRMMCSRSTPYALTNLVDQTLLEMTVCSLREITSSPCHADDVASHVLVPCYGLSASN